VILVLADAGADEDFVRDFLSVPFDLPDDRAEAVDALGFAADRLLAFLADFRACFPTAFLTASFFLADFFAAFFGFFEVFFAISACFCESKPAA
jgi:hypothetical protein